MNAQLPMTTDYQAVRAQLEEAIGGNLAEKEAEWLAKAPKHLSDEMRGGHTKDTASLMSLFTPDYYVECVESFDGEPASHAFLDFCIREMNEKIAYLALVAWPNAIGIGRDDAWSALSFPLSQLWGDKVSIKGEDAPETSVHASSNVRNVIWVDGEFVPEQIEEIYEAFDGDLDKAKAVYRDFTDGCATGMAMDDLTQLGGEIALGIPYTTGPLYTAIPVVWDRYVYHSMDGEIHKTKGGREIQFRGNQGEEADHYVIVRDADAEVFIEARRYDDPVSFADIATTLSHDEGDEDGMECVKLVVGRPASEDDEPQADLIMLDANFTDKGVFEEYSKHILADEANDWDGVLSIKFFVLETSYADFRAELEAREGITDVCALGEVVGTPSGEITQEMRDKARSLFSAGKGGTQAGDEMFF